MLVIDPEFQTLIPPLPDRDYLGLENSIKTEGCRDALVVWGSILLDGHNRYKICQEHNIGFETIDLPFNSRDDAIVWIVLNQFHRHNLNKYQRGKLALVLKPLIADKAKGKQVEAGKSKLPQKSAKAIDTRGELAKSAQVSHDTIAKVENIEKKATPEQKEKLETGEASINHIHKQIRTQERREEKTQQLLALSQEPATKLGDLGVFPVIYADPPWRYEHSKSDNRKIENQYPTMLLDDIKEIVIPTTPDAILFLWATSPKLAKAMEVINAWGFDYRTCMVWVKDKIGMGYYARQRHELLLIAIKGNMLTPEPASRPDSVIESPREEHSKKPVVVYELIEAMYPDLPKLEMFARTERNGWDVWGNEVS